MSLFSKKKKNEETENQVEVQGQATESKDEALDLDNPAVSKTDEKIAGRTAAIFGKMYRMIVSVNLAANVCQIESGERDLCGDILPQRMYYSAFADYIARHMHPDDQAAFAKDFSPRALADALTSTAGGYCKVYMMKKNAPKPAAAVSVEDSPETPKDPILSEDMQIPTFDDEPKDDVNYFEFRADLIPDNNPVKTRCMLFIKEVNEKPKPVAVEEEVVLDEEREAIDWDNLRMEKFFGGENVVFFEYKVEEDSMFIHNNVDKKTNFVKNYTKTIDARSDWSIYHGDTRKFKEALTDAAKGKLSEFEMRYRANGVKTASFKYHKCTMGPADSAVPAKWVIGILNDIDEEVKARNQAKDIADSIEKMMGSLYTDMFEIDMEHDLIYKIQKSESGFARNTDPVRFSDYINRHIANGDIDESSAPEFKKWLNKGYLEHQSLGGKYEFEAFVRLPGQTEHRWYSETVTKLEGGKHFLRFRRDITEIQEMRRQEYKLQEESRYTEYNRKLLDTMASLVEFRNVESGMHIQNVRDLTRILLTDLASRSPQYEITKHTVELYTEAATMHDIGKIVVPEEILNKPGRLTPEEFEIMKRHTTDGALIVERLNMPGQEELTACCRDVTLHHHERYDGSGYPDGLVGDKNPIGVQVIGLADVYDAMISVRCYKNEMTPQQAVDMILAGECGSFNPRLLESFKYCHDRMLALYQQNEGK